MSPLLISILAGLSMVGALAIDTYLPSMHAIGHDLDASPVLMQQTLSVFVLAFGLMMLFHGTLSDSFGRRSVILVALGVYVAASLGAACAPGFDSLLACRAVQGLAAGAGSVVGRAIVRDSVPAAHAQRVMSYITMVFGLAPALAPVLGGWLYVAFGWRAVFLFLTAFGALMFGACYRALPESLPRHARQPFHPGVILANYWQVLRHARFVLLALSIGLAFGGIALYIGAASNFVINVLGKSETGFGWLFFPLVAGMLLGSATAARLSTAIAPQRLVAAGFAAMGAASLWNVAYTAAYVARVPWAVLPITLYVFGMSLATPAMTVIAMDFFPRYRGLVSSLQSSVQMLVFAVVSGVLAPLLFDSAFKLACGMLGGVALGLLCWIGAQRLEDD